MRKNTSILMLAALVSAMLMQASSAHARPVQYNFRIDNPVFDWRVTGGPVDEHMVSILERLAPAPDIHGSFVYDNEAEGGPAVTDFKGSAWLWNYSLANAPTGVYNPYEIGGPLTTQIGWSVDNDFYFLNWASLNYLALDGQLLDLLSAPPASLNGATGSIDLFFNGPVFEFHPIRVSGVEISEVPVPPALLLFGSALLSLFRRRAKTS